MVSVKNINQSLFILLHEIVEPLNCIMKKLFNRRRYTPRIAWIDESQQTLAIGTLWQVSKSGINRFSEIHQSIELVYENSIYLNKVDNDYLSRVFGGFSYFEDCRDDTWEAFKTSSFILPKYIFFKKDEKSTVVLIHSFLDEDHPDTIEKSLIDEFDEFYSTLPSFNKEPKIPKISKIEELTNKREWINGIEQALHNIGNTNLEKVVIARTLQFHSNNRINPFSIFQKLLSSYPTCFNYYFELATDQVFLGASPELLLQKNNMSISTMALAGTTNRGIYEEGDIQLAKELLSSKKDRKEHQIVVQQIIDNLKSFIDPNTLSYGDTPHIHKIHNVQHLRTNISAQLKGEISLLEIISHLHPTPAVGGKPRSEALQLIRTIEGSRGWYASPVGYIKSNLDGKFIVGLRSALVQERIIHAFAGAGIVGASDPIKEWEETKLKFKPFLDALEVNNN